PIVEISHQNDEYAAPGGWLDHGAPDRRTIIIIIVIIMMTIIIADRRPEQMIYHWMPEICLIQL
uniref:Uncharacterized protein n=3 Tax=Anopheles atroparvus TaxID=41427 RepID=A0AAG5DS91_ANOAO